MNTWNYITLKNATVKTQQIVVNENLDNCFKYVDVSSVDSSNLKIMNYQEAPLRELPGRARKVIKFGDTIFATVRPYLKRIAFIEEDFDGELASTAFCIIRPNNTLNNKFVYFAVQMDSFMRGVIKEQRGASYPAVTDKDILNQVVCVPPMCEQITIKYILSTIQLKIELLNKQLTYYKQLKQSLMERLFTEGLHEEQRVESEEGLIPKSWLIKNLYEVADYTTGKLDSNAMVEGGKYPFFTCAQETFAINEFAFDQEALLLAGNNARGIYSIKYFKGKFNAYQRTYVITIKNIGVVKYSFLKYIIQRKLESLRAQSLGSTTKYITATILKNIRILLPSIEEQAEIAESLDTLESKIQNIINEHKTYEELFTIVLNNLMSQKIDVSNLKFENA